MWRTIVLCGLVGCGGSPASEPAARPEAPASATVQGCGLTLAGHVLAQESRPGDHGGSVTNCRFAADEPVAEFAQRVASEHPTWQESPPQGETRRWHGQAGDESLSITVAPASEAVRARHPNARSEVHVSGVTPRVCPPCGPNVWPPPGCKPCSENNR